MIVDVVKNKDPKKPSDTIICMRRDEFIAFISEGIKFLSEKEKRTGFPYFPNDIDAGYIHLSVLDDREYFEVFHKIRKLTDGIQERPGGRTS